jgi:hypothetical protein
MEAGWGRLTVDELPWSAELVSLTLAKCFDCRG